MKKKKGADKEGGILISGEEVGGCINGYRGLKKRRRICKGRKGC